MKTKTKKFSKKLLALFLAVVMAMTGFAGAMTAFAADSFTPYADESVDYNSIGWAVLTDEQVAAALLDYADKMLAQYGPQIDSLLANLLPTSGMYYWDYNSRSIGVNVGGIIKATINVRTHSLNEIFQTLNSVQDVVNGYSGFIGDAKNFNIHVGNMTRENTSACDIIKTVLGVLQRNCGDHYGADVIGELLRGGFDLGTLGSLANLDVYKIIQNLIGLPDGYQSDMVYNIAKHLILNNTGWFTAEEIEKYSGNDNSNFVYDTVLFEKLTSELLCKINVLVTYPDGSSSSSRREKIDEKMAAGMSYENAAKALGYDPNLVYSEENTGNILLFTYGNEKISLSTSDSLFSFGYQALDLAWKTVLQDTIKLIHVNNNNFDSTTGTNYDNQYYYWAKENLPGGWDKTNLPKMYSTANLNAWANAVYASYNADSAEAFLNQVKADYQFDRSATGEGKWSDIDSTRLFLKLRYSPLADYGFNMQTGPINLYLMQTGTPNLDAFFGYYDKAAGRVVQGAYKSQYKSVAGALNDGLIAGVCDLFVDRDNIYVNTPGDTSRPALTKINPTGEITADVVKTIANTITGNALKVAQYVADTTDQNILKAFYDANNKTLTEQNIESAMIPLLVACLGEINLGSGKLSKLIHPEDWDMCKDAEAVAYLCLRENLSFSIPNNNYDNLVTITTEADGSKKINATLEKTIIPMARDAVVYVMEAYVPVTDKDGKAWIAENPDHTDADIFDLFNSIVSYYGGDITSTKRPTTERANGVGALIGLCDENGNSLISKNNDLWTNVNLALNKLLPVVGTLLGNGYGKADSKDLVYNDIIKGVLEIGDTSIHKSGMGGVSNFLYRTLMIFCSEPIQKTPIINTVYNFLADLLNGLFGARYPGQSWKTIIPANNTLHPFDDLVKRTVLVGTDGNNLGVFQKIVCSLVEFTGYDGGKGIHDGRSAYPDSMLRGIAFALQAVNSFIPEAINNISEHTMSMATVTYDEAVAKGSTAAGRINVYITNNSTGVNTTYIEGKDMNKYTPKQMGRYYVKLTEKPTVTGDGATGAVGSWNSFQGKIIDPGKTLSIPLTVRMSDTTGTVNVQFKYDIVDENGNTLYSGLTSTGSRLGTNAQDWKDLTYNSSNNQFLDYPSKPSTADTPSSSSSGIYATTSFADMYGLMPKDLVLTTDRLSFLDNYNVAFVSGSEKTVDGFYCYDTGSVSNDNGSKVTVTKDNAVAVCDEDGNIIKTDRYDLCVDGVWDTNGGAGYTNEELGAKIKDALDRGKEVTQRTHLVYTLAQAKSAGIVVAAHKNIDGEYDTIYLKSGSGEYSYSNLLSRITLRGPVAGTVINRDGKLSVNGGPVYTSLLQYDGYTHIPAGEYPINMCIYTSGGTYFTNTPVVPFKLFVGETGSSNSSSQSTINKYNDLVSYLANYKTDDFVSADTLSAAQNYVKSALNLMGTAVTAQSVLKLGDPAVINPSTFETVNKTGDLAYTAFTTSNATRLGMPQNLKDNATVGSSSNNGKTGVYYYDAECTMPIYSNQPLTTATLGKDNAGFAVIAGEGDNAGKYFLANSVLYEQVWDTRTYAYPWLRDSDVQATDDMGNPLYSQTEYMYIASNGDKVSSGDNWVAKYAVPDTQFVQKDAQVDRRGYYTLADDCLDYAEYLVNSGLKPGIADPLLRRVSEVRSDLEEYNFDVVTYNKMVKLAKTAEGKYSINMTYTYDKPVIDENGEIKYDSLGNPVTTKETKTVTVPFLKYKDYANNPDYTISNVSVKSTLSSTQVAEYIRLFDFYTGKVVERGYLGNQLEKEIECASGNVYTALNVTPATYNDDGTVATEAVITKAAGAVAPEFGKWAADGTLVNEGDKVYSEASWSEYKAALAEAVDMAKHGNTDYTYKERDYFNISDNDNYDAQVTECYVTDSRLQVAENSLEETGQATVTVASVEGGTVTVNGVASPYVAELGEAVKVEATADLGYQFEGFKIGDTVVNSNPYTFTVKGDVTITPIFTSAGKVVSGDIVVATSYKGETAGKAAYGSYTIDIYDSTGQTLVTSTQSVYDGDNFTNKFTVSLPDGEYKAKVYSEYSLPREGITITVGANDITNASIPVIACDFNADSLINIVDIRTVKTAASSSAGREYCDLNADGIININDVRIVKVCSSSAPDLKPIEIK